MKRIAITSARQSPIGSTFSYKQDFINESYVEAIFKAGALGYILPFTDPPNALDLLDGFDALLLPGGEDIDPLVYGAEETYSINRDAALDRLQIALVHAAMRLEIPILGICRGLQIINITLGGTLYQDIKREFSQKINHLRLDIPYLGAHTVKIESDSFLYRVFKREILDVNSVHHQGIKDLGYGLRATAISPDGLIEAVEGENMVGVQWHPEAQYSEMQDLFRLFIEEYIS